MDKFELQTRTKQFALRTLKLAEALPRTRSGNIVANQLGRCATSVGANYRSACKARSRAEFIAKIGVVEEEADESGFWMEIVMEGGLLKASRVKSLHVESRELVAIMAASRTTASRRGRTNNRQSAIGNRQ
jgi:four helix bundle protein